MYAINCELLIILPPPYRMGHNASMTVVCVCPSVPCLTLKLRTEGCRKLKIHRKEAHDKADPWPN